METNIRSNHWLCQMTNPHMAARGGGSIMIISSVGGLRAGGVLGAYGISKAADLQIARALAVEFGGDNIRVNAIAPGLIRTDFARALWEDKERVQNAKPLRRLAGSAKRTKSSASPSCWRRPRAAMSAARPSWSTAARSSRAKN